MNPNKTVLGTLNQYYFITTGPESQGIFCYLLIFICSFRLRHN